MAGLDTNKISNIIGTKLPQWIINQLGLRSIQNSRDSRKDIDESNLLYLANKSAWVRFVSSIDIINPSDQRHFNVTNETDLAEQFVLFGGTSKYIGFNFPLANTRVFFYKQRSGLGQDGAYGILGDKEIKEYGYRPMPGITSVTIETLGKLGSLRQATINFKCWDKLQLDIIDALYFKLGYTMFLEWGNTYFYSEKNPNKLQSSELYSIDPFKPNLNKEDINIQISKNVRDSEGNYDAMLGIVTNFNFEYNQEGGYNCSVKLTGLGILADNTKINNPGTLSNILRDEILLLSNTLADLSRVQNELPPSIFGEDRLFPKDLLQTISLYRQLLYQPTAEFAGQISTNTNYFSDLKQEDFEAISFRGGGYYSRQAYKEFLNDLKRSSLSYLVVPSAYTNNVIFSDIEKLQKLEYYKFDYFFQQANNLIYASDRLGTIIKSDILSGYTDIKLNGNILDSLIKELDKRIQYVNGFTDGSPEGTFLRVFSNYKGTGKNQNNYNLDLLLYYDIKNPKIVGGESLKEEIRIPLDFSSKLITQLIDKIKLQKEQNIPNSNLNFKLINLEADLDSQFTNQNSKGPTFTLSIEYPIDIFGTVDGNKVKIEGAVRIDLIFNDASLIESIKPPIDSPSLFIYNEAQIKLEEQNQKEYQTALENERKKELSAKTNQISQALSFQSSIELTLRTIQVHALNSAFNKRKNLDINSSVYVLEIYDPTDIVSGTPFYKQIFSNGIFTDCIDRLISSETEISDSDYTAEKAMDPIKRFEIQAKYGFATEVMAGREPISKFRNQQVNYKKLLNAFVVPYDISQEIVSGVSTQHPVYIPLGLLLMILNHNCSIYDTKNTKLQTPLVYIDFNPNLNYLLSSRKQLSTNPWKVLIPFEGDDKDYKSLFLSNIIEEKNGVPFIKKQEGSSEDVPLFNFRENDALSRQIPSLKFDPNEPYSAYKGKLMNILVNIDYLIDLVRDYSMKDTTSNIYLKTFLEVVLSDINKYLGNFNALRLSYNDGANTYQIVDDQFMPPSNGEKILEPNDNITEIPLKGKNSLAKNLVIKTEVSSKLSNLLAISSNTNSIDKAKLSVDGSSVGFINTAYKDRYISAKGDLTINSNSGLEAIKGAAIQFNQTIDDFYSSTNPSEANVSQATNYYIEKMAFQKNADFATRASTPIPLSANFTIDGISGLTMGQAFTISPELIPYTYNVRSLQTEQGLGPDHVNKVGFIIFGLTNTIENNQWNTSIRANMTYLKYATEYSASAVAPSTNTARFTQNPYNLGSTIHGEVLNVESFGGRGSRSPRNTDQTRALSALPTSDYIFGKAFQLGNSVTAKAHGARESSQVGQWQSENAWDLIVPAFTPVYAIFSGTVDNVNYYEDSPYIWGYRFTLNGANNSAWYTHLDRVVNTNGTVVSKGQLLGYVGKPPSDFTWPTHLHIGLKTGALSTYLDTDGKIK